MTGTEPNFSAVIPAQAPGSTVEYYLEATDVAGQIKVGETRSFYLFQPSGAPTLVVLNGYTATSGYPIDYFFGPDIQSGDFSFDHDAVSYTHLRAHETVLDLVCRFLLEKKKNLILPSYYSQQQ